MLAGCATKAVYQRLDFFIGWRLGDYVSFNDEQAPRYKRAFADLWRWHRAHELPRYAREMREIIPTLDGRIVRREQVAARSAAFQAHWERLMDQTVTGMCGVLRTLDDAQLQEILEGVDEDIEDFAKEYVEPSEKDLRRKSEKRTERWIKRWTGPLNAPQKALLSGWGQERRGIGPVWLEHRKQWRTRLQAALQERGSSPACDVFRPLFVTPMTTMPEGLVRDIEYNQQLWNQLIADVIVAMDERQRKRARGELEELAGQLEQLAAMPH